MSAREEFSAANPATGRCLCGAVSYEVRGPLRDILLCHCVECRRWHGHVSASTAAHKEDLVLLAQHALRWIDSPGSYAGARRGFCAECGSSLFWDPPRRAMISIAAGTLDRSTGLRIAGHWYTSQAGDYYEIVEDGTPLHAFSGERGKGRPGACGPDGPSGPMDAERSEAHQASRRARPRR